MSEIQALNVAQNQLHLVRALQAEYMRLRRVAAANVVNGPQNPQDAQSPLANIFAGMNTAGLDLNANQPQIFNPAAEQPVMGADDPNLPQGLTLPSGWSLLPLHRADGTVGQGESGSSGVNQHAHSGRSTAQSANDAAASLQTWNDTMTRTLHEARNRNYNPAEIASQPPPGVASAHRSENPPPGFRTIPLDPNDPGVTVQTTHGPHRLPTQIANQLLAQHGNTPVPVGYAPGLAPSGPSDNASADTSSSPAQPPQPATAGSSDTSTDVTHTTTTSEESSAKAQEPSTADNHQRDALSNGVSSSTSAIEQPPQSLQARVEDGEDDDE